MKPSKFFSIYGLLLRHLKVDRLVTTKKEETGSPEKIPNNKHQTNAQYNCYSKIYSA